MLTNNHLQMKLILSTLLAFVTFVHVVFATDYCASNLCSSGGHIACGNDGTFKKNCPADSALVNINDKLRTIILNAHNEKRDLIAGGGDSKHKRACRMATMQWDNELASLAALNVKQCEMNHDSCRNTNAFKFSGQNLAWMTYYNPVNHQDMLKKAVQMWYNEVSDSNMNYINSYPKNYKGPAIGHFTVMMADRNIRVGCAAATYSVKNEPYKAYLVSCNYATTNMIGHPIYKACSKAASSCTTGKNPTYRNLCSIMEAYEVNKWF